MKNQIKIVTLKEKIPLMFKGNPTWYDVGDNFAVVEEKIMPIVGLTYKLSKCGCILDGNIIAKNFNK